MDFIEHTAHWVKGEIFEGSMVLLSGVLTLVCSVLVWHFGTTVNSKSLVLPFFIISVLFVAMGVSMVYSNNKRLPEMKEMYQQNATEFIQKEKNRVEEFQILYPISLAVSSICFIITLAFFWFSKNETLYATGIVLSLFGVALLVIDYFSKERATIYYEQILNQIQ